MSELIRIGEDGSIGFGDYTLFEKTKADFEFKGDVYKVKTFRELTRLEKNEILVFESIPGTNVDGLKVDGNKVSFTVSGDGNTRMTLGLEDDTEYKVTVDGVQVGKMSTGLGGKLDISAELFEGESQVITIERM